MRTIIAASMLVGAIGVASAQEVSIEPGLWEMNNNFNISVTMMNGQAMDMPAQNQTDKECVSSEDAVFRPEDLADESCTVSNIKSASRSISFDISCQQQGVLMSGSMSYEVSEDGKSGAGTMTAQGQMPGMGAMSLSGQMTGKRVGDC